MAKSADTIKINEILFSIQGESTWTGQPTVFVRTSGCHLRCHYCDTTYAYHEGGDMRVDEIMSRIAGHATKYVCVTGGEPLLQPGTLKLMRELCDRGYYVSLETSGDRDCSEVDPRVKKIIDVKTPDSGEPNSFFTGNLRYADRDTEFKFVICSPKDFDWAVDFAAKNGLFASTNVLFSPSFGQLDARWLAEKILSSAVPARMQIQLHKFIWPDQARGV